MLNIVFWRSKKFAFCIMRQGKIIVPILATSVKKISEALFNYGTMRPGYMVHVGTS